MGFIAAAIGAIAGSIGGALGGIVSGLGSAFGSLFGGLLKNFVMKALNSLLAPKPGGGGIGVGDQNRTLTIKQEITHRQIVYGRIMMSGPIIYFNTAGGDSSKEYLHIIIPLASHECEEIETVFCNQFPVVLDAAGEVLGSGPGVGTIDTSTNVLTLTDPNSALLNDTNVGKNMTIKAATAGPDRGSVTATVQSITSNVAYVNESDLTSLELVSGDRAVIQKNTTVLTEDVPLTFPGDGTIGFTLSTDGAAEVSAGDVITISLYSISSEEKTAEVTAIDKDEGTITFDSFGSIVNGSTVYITHLDDNRLAGTKYKDNLRIKLHLGSDDQTADPDAVAELPDWTEDHRLRGITYIYARLKKDDEAYPNGVPNLSAIVKGKKVYDPRTGTTAYSTNPALCIRDYFLDTRLGLGKHFTSDDFDTDIWNTAANVCDETVDLKDGGTEVRYSCNGNADTKKKPAQLIGELLSSCSGTLVRSGGIWKLKAGAYTAPTLTLTEDNTISPLSIETRVGRRESFNGVKGIYISEGRLWQQDDYPVYKNDTYISEDGGFEIWQEFNLGFTSSPSMAQRLAKIELEKVRQGITVNGTFDLNAFALSAGDTVNLTNAQLGWDEKPFEVQEWDLVVINDEDGKKALGVEMELRETASTIYDWDPDSEETTVDPAPDTNLGSLFITPGVQNVVVTSGEDDLFIGGDGTVISRMRVTWTPPTSQLVLDGGRVEVQYKKDGDTIWIDGANAPAAQNEVYLSTVEDQALYNVRVRLRNAYGIDGPWSEYIPHRVIGKSAVPDNVQSFVALQNGALVSFTWKKVTNPDLAGYEIRYGPQGNATWANGTLLVSRKAGNTDTSAIVPPGSHTFMIKALDTSGNYSLTATRYSLTVSNTFTVDTSLTMAEFGDLAENTNLLYHHTGKLIPDSITDANTSDDIWNWGNVDLEELCYHTLPEVDLSSDKTVRVWANIISELLPGITSGSADPQLQLRWRADGEDFAETDLESLNLLEAAGSVYTNCVYHHTNKLIPDSELLATDDSTMDEFVPGAYTDWSYESPEIDLGADTSIFLTIDSALQLGPGETGTANATFEINRKADGGSYGGWESFTEGRINARYFKFKISSNSSTGKTVISNVGFQVDDFQDWTIGDVTARYVQARIKIDTTVGKMMITDYTIAVDEDI